MIGLLELLWTIGLIARGAIAMGLLGWPWVWPRAPHVQMPLVLLPLGTWLFLAGLWLLARLLVLWPLQGLVVLLGLAGWHAWQAICWSTSRYRQGRAVERADNVVPMRRR